MCVNAGAKNFPYAHPEAEKGPKRNKTGFYNTRSHTPMHKEVIEMVKKIGTITFYLCPTETVTLNNQSLC
jgi:hypothetical protein